MRTISTYRRRPGLIDMVWPHRDAVSGYILKAAANFDAPFVPFANVPPGYVSRSARAAVGARMESGAFKGKHRIVLSLADFAMDDTKPLWLRIAQVSINGVVGADESIHLILPYSSQPRRPVVLNGTVPNAANVVASLELNLPEQCTNPMIQNGGGVDLFVAFEPGGAEFQIPPLTTGFTDLYSAISSFSQLFLRGSGAATAMSANLVLRNEAA